MAVQQRVVVGQVKVSRTREVVPSPSCGVGGLAFDQREPSRAHGRDERIGVESFHRSVAPWDALVQRLAGPPVTVP